jgi:hypothetical protein
LQAAVAKIQTRGMDAMTVKKPAKISAKKKPAKSRKPKNKCRNDAAAMPVFSVAKEFVADDFYRPEKRVSPTVGKQLNWWIVDALVLGLCCWYGAAKLVPFVYHLLRGR